MRLPRITAESLRTFALFAAAPLFGGLLAWQLYGLEPDKLCKTSFAMAKVDGAGIVEAFKACIGLMSKVLDIKDHALIGLLAILGLGYVMMLMRELRLQGSISGPGGTGMNLTPTAEPVARALDASADALREKADEIAGDRP